MKAFVFAKVQALAIGVSETLGPFDVCAWRFLRCDTFYSPAPFSHIANQLNILISRSDCYWIFFCSMKFYEEWFCVHDSGNIRKLECLELWNRLLFVLDRRANYLLVPPYPYRKSSEHFDIKIGWWEFFLMRFYMWRLFICLCGFKVKVKAWVVSVWRFGVSWCLCLLFFAFRQEVSVHSQYLNKCFALREWYLSQGLEEICVRVCVCVLFEKEIDSRT